MRTNRFTSLLKLIAAILLAVLGLARPGLAQRASVPQFRAEIADSGSGDNSSIETGAPEPLVKVSPIPTAARETPLAHRFWDRENKILFSTNVALSAADFVVTRNNLRSGGQELNPITRVFSGSTPALAMNFAGETAGVLGVDYFLHKTGHHKLERVFSVVNIGGSAAAVAFGLLHR